MNPTTTKPFANALTARQEIDALYTPLDEAVAELQRRRQDTKLCARVEDFHRALPPDFLPNEPFAALLRYIATPNLEFDLFSAIARKIGLRPLYVEYQSDIFLARNPDKYRLFRPAFLLRENHTRNLRLVEFNQIEGRALRELKTINDMDLVRYHHALLEHAFPSNGQLVTDISAWASKARDGEFYYLSRMALFICHGILLENFVANDESELRFTREKVLPSFAKAAEIFGVRPLIVPLLPRESEGSDYWRCLPGSLYPYAAELLSTKS